MRKIVVALALVPALAFAQGKDKPSANITGFIALDAYKWVKKEGSYEEMNVGIGTLNLDARARYQGTSLKFKLDLDGNLSKANNIFEEANVTQEVAPWLAATAGKGVVPFHQKHYGVIKDSYVDGGTVVGNYYWNFGDQDRKYLLGMAIGERDAALRSYVTFFADSEYQVQRDYATGVIQTQNVSSSDGAKTGAAGKEVATQVAVPAVNSPMKGADPRDQRGVAYKAQLKLSNEMTVAAGALTYWNRLDPQLSYAFVTNGSYEEAKFLEVWFEAQYGASSSYRYSFKNKKEILAQIGADAYLTDDLSVLADLEVATFSFDKVADTAGKNTLDTQRATLVKYDGTLAKMEAGVATHFSDRATWTNGILYEIGAVNVNKVALQTGRTGRSFVSTFTFAF